MPENSSMEQKRPEAIVEDSLTKILRQLTRRLVVKKGPEAEIECHGIGHNKPIKRYSIQ